MVTKGRSVLALDVGERRIGVAVAGLKARIARPLVTLEHNDALFTSLQTLAKQEGASALIVGLPRGLEGQRTAQTATTEAFAQELQKRLDLPCYMQDEAVTSKKAKAELEARGKPYAKGDVDALAATYILDDFLAEHPEMTA